VDSLNVESFYDGTVSWYPFQVRHFSYDIVRLINGATIFLSQIKSCFYVESDFFIFKMFGNQEKNEYFKHHM